MKWYVGVILLLLAGLVLQLGLLVYAMYALLGVMLLSRYFADHWISGIQAVRRCPSVTVGLGESVTVQVVVHNSRRYAIPWLVLEDSVPLSALAQRPPAIKLKKRRFSILRLAAGKDYTLDYRVRFDRRGYYQIGPLLVETGDVFGLHRRYRVLAEPAYILVLPKVIPLTGYDVASRRPIGEVTMTHRLFEDPTRIAGVREYQTGDPLNRVNWRATARTGTLQCKVYEPSCMAGASLLLDFHADCYPARSEPYRSDLAISTAVALANAVYLLGQPVGIFSNGRDAADRIRQEGFRQEFTARYEAQQDAQKEFTSERLRPVAVLPNRGAEHFLTIRETLARLELTDGLTYPDMIADVASRMPRDASVIAILADVPPETAIALGNLRRSGYAVTAVVLMYDDERQFALCAGRLMAEGIEARRVDNEDSLTQLCSQRLAGGLR